MCFLHTMKKLRTELFSVLLQTRTHCILGNYFNKVLEWHTAVLQLECILSVLSVQATCSLADVLGKMFFKLTLPLKGTLFILFWSFAVVFSLKTKRLSSAENL